MPKRSKRSEPRSTLFLASLLLQGCAFSTPLPSATPSQASPIVTSSTASATVPLASQTLTLTPQPSTVTATSGHSVSAGLNGDATASPTVSLLFTGDINPSRCPAQAALEADDFTVPYVDVAGVLRAADLTIGSLDGALSDRTAPAPCATEAEYNLVGPTRTVEGLTFAGFDVITLATNHAQDCGRLGFVCDGLTLIDSLRALREAGIEPVGAGEDLAAARRAVVVERKGLRLAFLAVSAVGDFAWASDTAPGTAPLSDDHLQQLLRDIADARDSADVVVVLVHWGVEYDPTPSADQRRWARRMIDAGADLVVGNHPHVAQPVEALDGGLAAYALGNFVFDQDPDLTRHSLVLETTFNSDGLQSWRTLPVEIVDLYRPQWR